MIVGFEACLRHRPSSLIIDTLGNAFAYPAFRLLWPTVQVVSYTHYPFISEDMIGKVCRGQEAFNNSQLVARNPLLRAAKVAYYRVLLWVYAWCGGMIGTAMANSNWTAAHLKRIWKRSKIHLVYPPCDVKPFLDNTAKRANRNIVSLSQFRPEKNHRLQLEAFAHFLQKYPQTNDDVNLVMIGGCRDESDRQRVDELKRLAIELGISDRVQIKTDLPFDQVCSLLKTSFIGLHTMPEEHFGISIVEFMAAGLITVAHGSGGPKTDIIEPGVNGFLATDAQGYAAVLASIYSGSNETLDEIKMNARKKATEVFSLAAFQTRFLSLLRPTFNYESQ